MRINKEKIKIYWDDAVIYKNITIEPLLSKRITIGEFVKKDKNYIVVKNPTTSMYDIKTKKYIQIYKDNKQTFFYVPNGMIVKIEKNISNNFEKKLKTFSLNQLKNIAKDTGIKFFTENLSKEDVINIIISDAIKEDLEKLLK